MAHRANHYATNYNPSAAYNPAANRSQGSRAINEMGSLMGSMALGPGTGDDALFRQRLELAKKYRAETEGVSLKNAMLQMRNEAALSGGEEGYDNMQSVNPQWSQQLALALTENQKRPGILEKQGMLNQARKMFLPRSPEEKDAAQWAALERGDMGFGGKGVGPKHTEGDLMRAFNLISNKTTGAGDSFTMADKLGLRAAQPKHTLADTQKAEQIKSMTEALLGKTAAETLAISSESEQKQELLKAQTLGVGSTTGATTSKIEAQEGAITAESEETVKLLQQKVVKEQAATWVQRATERAIRTGTRNKNAESGQKLLLLQAQTGVYGQQANAIVAAIANKDYESALRGMKTATEAMVTLQLGDKKREEIGEQMKVLQQQVLNLQAEQTNKDNETEVRVEKEQAKTELVETQIENLDLQQTNLNLESAETQDLIKGKTDLTSAITTGQQVKTFDDSNLTKAKTALVGAKEEGEFTDIAATMMGTNAAGQKGSGKNQFDHRKTGLAARQGNEVSAPGFGVAYRREVGSSNWLGDKFGLTNTETTWMWKDDDEALRNIMLPFPKDRVEQEAKMKAGRLFLSKKTNYPAEDQSFILKSILGLTKKPE